MRVLGYSAVAMKEYALFDYELGCTNIAYHDTGGKKNNFSCSPDVTFNDTADNDRIGFDKTSGPSAPADQDTSFGPYVPLEITIDPKEPLKIQIATC